MNTDLWPHQEEAIAHCADRPLALVSMFCGTGKSRTMFEHRRRFHADPGHLCILLVPRLALKSQMVLTAETDHLLSVGSDLGGTTDAVVIRRALCDPAAFPLVICTYQSFELLLDICRALDYPIDALYCDEAHHLAEPNLRRIFDPWLREQDVAVGTKRARSDRPAQLLLFTATPPTHWRGEDTSRSAHDEAHRWLCTYRGCWRPAGSRHIPLISPFPTGRRSRRRAPRRGSALSNTAAADTHRCAGSPGWFPPYPPHFPFSHRVLTREDARHDGDRP
jgi:hypothetical protein